MEAMRLREDQEMKEKQLRVLKDRK